jgi:thioredoxin 1
LHEVRNTMDRDHPLDADMMKLRDRRLREMDAQRAGPAHAAATAAPAAPVDVDEAGLASLVASRPLVVVDAWAAWCGPCRAIAPVLDELARELAGEVTIAKLDVDQNPGAAQRLGIVGIPTLLVFRHGRIVDRIVGGRPKEHLRKAFLAHARA